MWRKKSEKKKVKEGRGVKERGGGGIKKVSFSWDTVTSGGAREVVLKVVVSIVVVVVVLRR